MSFKGIFIWRSGGPFVQRSGTICAILVEGIKRNNCEIILNSDQWFDVLCIMWSSGGPFVWRSVTICAILE